ncbi:hypothetical protein [Hyalangium sp.]|uniref:hypothetical protein n=1 Tax=Hyalangium sp. TaxID=2028555 RepID=UPI002D6C43A6|nr:hypothetical protein [Hyalangium sp.]HYH96141.1 hypothetical protein [Hyalangium sp.]
MSEPEAVPPSQPEAAVAGAACSLCQNPMAAGAGTIINGNSICDSCAEQVQAELAAEQQTGARFPIALAGGAVGALVGAVIWAAIVVATNYEIGYVAVLVGYLAGLGVKLGAGKGRGRTLQIAAAGIAVFGLVIAKYFILAHFVVSAPSGEELGLGYFSPSLFILFLQNIDSSLSAFDLLWIAFALMTAWRIPAPSKIEVGQ